MTAFPRLKKWKSRLFIDCGQADAAIFLAGMGRSGTTWAADLLNFDSTYRIMFEPFQPSRVKEAAPFRYIHYMNARDRDPLLSTSAKAIVGGKIRNKGVDLDNPRFLYRRRIIKDIRCNLMLGWLKAICPGISIILMVRHPLSVAASWLKLGWGGDGENGGGSDYRVITSQKRLLNDFPIIRNAMQGIDSGDPLQRIIFQWCVFHVVPFRQVAPGEFFVLFYENLIIDPEKEIQRLFAHLNRPSDWSEVRQSLDRVSRTNYLGRVITQDREKLLTGWQELFTERQRAQTRSILAMFGLEGMYDAEGRPGVLPLAGKQVVLPF